MVDNVSHNPQASELLAYVNKLEGQKKCNPVEVTNLLNQILELEPEYVPGYVKRSSYLFGAYEYGLALDDLNRAIELGTKDPDAYFRRAECYGFLGMSLEDRMADIKKTLKLNPHHAEAHGALGHYYYDKGYKNDALIHFTDAIDAKSNDPMVFLKRAILNMEEEKYEFAIVDLLNSQKCNPRNSIVYSLRAECYHKIGAMDKAIQDYKSAAFIEPSNPDHYYNMGLLHYEKGELNEAIAHFNMVIEMMPDSSLGYYSRGIAHLENNDAAAAIPDLEKAFEMAPNAETCQLLTIAYAETGNDELSQKYYDKAVEMGAQTE